MREPAKNTVRPNKHAFTLVELLVVISIIALLLAILMPALQGARRQAQGVVCMSNAHQTGLLLKLYSNDYRGHYPYSTAWRASYPNPAWTYTQYYNLVTFWNFMAPYMVNKEINKCPSNPANQYVSQVPNSGNERNPKAFGYAFNTEFGYCEPDPNKQKDPATAIPLGPSTTPTWFTLTENQVKSPSSKIVVTESVVSYYNALYMYKYLPVSAMEYSYRIFPARSDDILRKNYYFKQAGIHGGRVNNILADGAAMKPLLKEIMFGSMWMPDPSRTASNPWQLRTTRPSGAPPFVYP